MIKRKKKICKGTGKFIGLGCGKERYLFSHGLCQSCYKIATYKPLKRTPLKKYKPIYQDKEKLSQIKTFYKAHEYYHGRCYINGYFIPKMLLMPYNCLHVLSKKQYPYFKFYWKNIIIGEEEHHDIYDKGTLRDIIKRRVWANKDTKGGWRRLFDFKKELIQEYEKWVRENKGVYKL